MSDTPETDILEEDVHVACEFVNPPEWKLIVPSSLARSLEIRLNKALKERDEARRERDEARQELAIIKKQLEAVEGLMLDLDEKLQEERKHNAELYDEVARYE